MVRPTHLLALGGVAIAVLLYWKPISNYEHVHAALGRRQNEVDQLKHEKQQLETRLASVDSGQTLVQEARRLGLVKPGEQLFIVRGIAAWRHEQK
jgi:cell division protein FtsB